MEQSRLRFRGLSARILNTTVMTNLVLVGIQLKKPLHNDGSGEQASVFLVPKPSLSIARFSRQAFKTAASVFYRTVISSNFCFSYVWTLISSYFLWIPFTCFIDVSFRTVSRTLYFYGSRSVSRRVTDFGNPENQVRFGD